MKRSLQPRRPCAISSTQASFIFETGGPAVRTYLPLMRPLFQLFQHLLGAALALMALLGLGPTDSLANDLRTSVGKPYQRLIERISTAHRLDPRLLSAMVEVESARQPDVVSHAGAIGLAQLMPQTARRFGVSDPTDPEENLIGGARYLSWLLDRYRGDVSLALAAYNAGEGAVDRYGGIPPYSETQKYVKMVMRRAGYSRSKRSKPRPARIEIRKSRDGTIVITNQPSSAR